MNCDTIIKELEEMIDKKIPVGASYYLDSAQKLVVLMGDETDKLYALQKKVAQVKSKLILEGSSVAKATAIMEAGDDYEEMKKQKAKVERISEFIRIAKLQSRMKDSEFRSNF